MFHGQVGAVADIELATAFASPQKTLVSAPRSIPASLVDNVLERLATNKAATLSSSTLRWRSAIFGECPAMCGVRITFSNPHRGWSEGSGSTS